MNDGITKYDCRDCLFFHEAGIDASSIPEVNSRIIMEPLMDTDFSTQAEAKSSTEKQIDGSHEVLSIFADHKLNLNLDLNQMLNEMEHHQGGRKGSGFTQSSRHLADFIRRPRSQFDINMFDYDVRESIEDEIYDSRDEDYRAPADAWREVADERGIEDILGEVRLEESKLITGMITDIVKPKEDVKDITRLPSVDSTLNIGTCTSAEYYFLNYLNNPRAIGYVGEFNIILDTDGTPLMYEKMGYGENHSCLTLKPTILNGVEIPVGSLVGVKRPKDSGKLSLSDGTGNLIDVKDCEGFEFLRLSTLAVSPANRERAFGNHFKFQSENRMTGYDTSSIEDFSLKANRQVLTSTSVGAAIN